MSAFAGSSHAIRLKLRELTDSQPAGANARIQIQRKFIRANSFGKEPALQRIPCNMSLLEYFHQFLHDIVNNTKRAPVSHNIRCFYWFSFDPPGQFEY